jgi:hypothetical protein
MPQPSDDVVAGRFGDTFVHSSEQVVGSNVISTNEMNW